ncbi:RecF/RecN/SMC N terminal domain-containing protein [Besnoitia besnoiti]|uniref:Structural maintenance of chromosomes protein 5 n=1 Tax=Besnoitia besnoiti TaxID=94643 RepID=A0A2A9MH30_BESBE|nr:RecF/RecN/SMC N terminal domain-containing protein [Besnoitia besnoiti]PFH34897.1 RecF/RecN/SMC N terminal domain-containing protein [Besnoitia besnoiti]
MARLGSLTSGASGTQHEGEGGVRRVAPTQAELTARFPFVRDCLPGQLLQLRLENWMAYTGPVEVNFLTGINLLAAPNGAGKSSLLCAMAFGLGYDVSHISRRGSRLRDFIKVGFSTCSVACVLVGRRPGEFVTTKRELRLSGDQTTSTFYINGRECGVEARAEFHRKLKLQVDNLICFMPQERVPEFATMRPEALFMATLRAIDFDLHEAYVGLRDWEAKREETEALLTEGRADLLVLSRAVEKLRLEHEELQRLQGCEKKRILCEGKILQLRLSAVRQSRSEQMRGREKLEKKLDKAKAAVARVDEKLRAVEAVLRRVTQDRGRLTARWIRAQETVGTQLEDFVADAMADVERLESKIAALPEKAQEWKAERERLEKEFAVRHTVLERARATEEKVRLEAERDKAHVAARMQEIQDVVAECSARRRALQQEAAEARLRLQTLESEEQDLHRQIATERRKEAILRENREGAAVKNLFHFLASGGGDRGRQQSLQTALQLQREKKLRHSFGPVALITKVRSARYRPYVEHLLQARLAAFVCVDEEEMKLLSRLSCHGLLLRADLRGRVRLPTATAQMKAMGVECFIHEQLAFEAASVEDAAEGERGCVKDEGAGETRDDAARRRRQEAVEAVIRETVVSFTNANSIFVARDSLTPQEEQRMQQFMKDELARVFQFPVRKLVYFKGNAVHSVQKSIHDNFWIDACDVLRTRLPAHAQPPAASREKQGSAGAPAAASTAATVSSAALAPAFAGVLDVVAEGVPRRVGEGDKEASACRRREEAFAARRVQILQERERHVQKLEELETACDNVTRRRQMAVAERQTLIEKDTKLAKAAHDVAFAKELFEAVATEIRALDAKRPPRGALLAEQRRLQQRIWDRLSEALCSEQAAAKKLHALADSWLKMREEAASVEGYREELRKLKDERQAPAQEVLKLEAEVFELAAAIAVLEREIETRADSFERWNEEAALLYRNVFLSFDDFEASAADPSPANRRSRQRKRLRGGDEAERSESEEETVDRKRPRRSEDAESDEDLFQERSIEEDEEQRNTDFRAFLRRVKDDLRQANLPDDEAELKSLIDACTEELERSGGGNRQAFRDFRAKVQEKKKRETDVARLEEKAKSQQEKIDKVKESWHRRITEIVSTVSRRFGVFLKFINPDASGYVALHDPAAPSSSSDASASASSGGGAAPSVRDLELRICVSFYRGQPPRPLNTRHSGGERSLSTVLYLLAVQAYAREGFRVLDEINQGLDGEKEKKLFALLTRVARGWEGTDEAVETRLAGAEESSAAPARPAGGGVQYILLTPQLVKGTDYSSISVHFPFSGLHLQLRKWHDEGALCAGAEAVRRQSAKKEREEPRGYWLDKAAVHAVRQILREEDRRKAEEEVAMKKAERSKAGSARGDEH